MSTGGTPQQLPHLVTVLVSLVIQKRTSYNVSTGWKKTAAIKLLITKDRERTAT